MIYTVFLLFNALSYVPESNWDEVARKVNCSYGYYQAAYYFILMCAGFFNGWLSDKIGRKPVYTWCFLTNLVSVWLVHWLSTITQGDNAIPASAPWIFYGRALFN